RPQADPRRLLKAAGEALRDVPLERIASMPAEEAHGLAAKIFEGAAAPQPEDPPLAPALARFEAEFRAPARLAGVAEAKLPAVLSPAGRRTPLVFVLVHGLGESPAGMERLARLLAEQGHNVVSTLLSGHGSTSEALEGVPLARWDQDVDRAAAFARELGERVVLVGFSLGGNLAFRAARRMGSDAAGLLLLSPGLSFGPPLDRKLKGRAAAGARWTTDQPLADEYSNPRVPMSTYPEVSAAMAAAREAVAAAAGSAAPLLSVPSLTVASASDGYIDHDLLRAFAAAAGSELLVYSDRSMRHNEPIRPPGSWPEAFLAALRRFLDKITP
ncbi:MAG TPA: alpha/beta hydrolase family protein, partial [Elusimicrobiota bacterium]|nr:alpha/beta hydrolase family protein [Elusimicrobiota bacterium]